MSCAANATKEYSPKSAGVVRPMAQSFHCPCVSMPRWARASSKVTSIRQRRTNHSIICCGVCEAVRHEGLGFKGVLRVANQYPPNGDGRQAGVIPHHTAVSVQTSTSRSPPPYQGVPRGRYPLRLRISPHVLQCGPTCPFLARAPALSWLARRGWIVKGGHPTASGLSSSPRPVLGLGAVTQSPHKSYQPPPQPPAPVTSAAQS
jgi:hypothetical protein